MNSTIISIFLSALLFVLPENSKATHMMGADMSYTCVGNGKYKITFKIYRDCRGISFNGPAFGAYAGLNGGNGCGSVSLSGVTRTGIRDITTGCSLSTSQCNPSNTTQTGKGIEEHTFEATVDFNTLPLSSFVNNSSCCEVTFYTGQCCRTGSITTGAANQDFYTTCMINICNIQKSTNKCNNSPNFSNVPVGFLCCNTPWYYSNAGIDNEDFDSISYRLVKGLRGLPNNSIPNSTPFTELYPLTPLCTPPTTIKCAPKPQANPPVGFYFDSISGDMVVTPTKCDEVATLVVELTEWRKETNGGSWIIVGKTRRDMTLWVLNDCGYNKPPIISGPNKWTICEGEKLCQTIKITDDTYTPNQKTPDTVIAEWNNGIPSATFRVIDSTKREKEYEFCWQTKLGDASDIAYSFTINASDQHCSPPLNSVRTFKVKVNPCSNSTDEYDSNRIHENNLQQSEFVVFPNPANEVLELKFLKDIKNEKYQIYDITETIVQQGQIEASKKLNIQKLKSGIYIIEVSGEKVKFVKE